jgi:hypothetical protein
LTEGLLMGDPTFTKTANQDILAGGKGPLYYLDERFDGMDGFHLLEIAVIEKAFNDALFGQGHGAKPLFSEENSFGRQFGQRFRSVGTEYGP